MTTFSVVGDEHGIDCLLCDHRGETIEEHEQHMTEVHDE